MARRPLSGAAVGATVGLTAVVVVAALVAALGEPVRLFTEGPRRQGTPPPPHSATPTGSVSPTTQITPGGEGLPVALGLLSALIAVAGLALLVLAVIALVRLLRRLRPRLTSQPEPDFEVPLVPEELLRSAADRVALLETGEPRNAIVAAWLDLETSAAASGLPRLPAETSSEYATRVIGTWDVQRDRLDDLAQLFREARFSRHELGEGHRARALADLRALHDDLERVSQTQRAGDPA